MVSGCRAQRGMMSVHGALRASGQLVGLSGRRYVPVSGVYSLLSICSVMDGPKRLLGCGVGYRVSPEKTSLLAGSWPIFAACSTWAGNRLTGIIHVTARQARQQYLRLGSFMWHVFAHSLRPQGLAPQMFAPLSCLLTRRFTRPCILLLCAYLSIQMFLNGSASGCRRVVLRQTCGCAQQRFS